MRRQKIILCVRFDMLECLSKLVEGDLHTALKNVCQSVTMFSFSVLQLPAASPTKWKGFIRRKQDPHSKISHRMSITMVYDHNR